MSFVGGLHTISSVRLFGCIGPFVKELSNRMYVANRPRKECGIRDGVCSRESNHQRSCLIYDLLGVCCGKSVCFAAAEPRLESVQIDFVGAANVPESNMDACIAKDEKASEPSPAVRHVVQQILGGCRHGDTGSKLLRWTSYQRCMGRCCWLR